jgi:hypothetical protein
MDIKNICSRPGIVLQGNITEATTAISTITVNPGVYRTVIATNSAQFTPMGWVSTLFGMWRGTLKYRITLAKTVYHTGVMEITYRPGTSFSAGNDASVYYLLHRRIWDISQSSSFEFEIPYACGTNWSDVHHNLASTSYGYRGAMNGVVGISMTTALHVSGGVTISSTVPYVVYVWSDDMEFAVPTTAFELPVVPGNYAALPPGTRRIASGTRVEPELPIRSESEFVPQIGPWGDEAPIQGKCGEPSQMFPVTRWTHITNANCVGEAVPNLRALTHRFDWTAVHRSFYGDGTEYHPSIHHIRMQAMWQNQTISQIQP